MPQVGLEIFGQAGNGHQPVEVHVDVAPGGGAFQLMRLAAIGFSWDAMRCLVIST